MGDFKAILHRQDMMLGAVPIDRNLVAIVLVGQRNRGISVGKIGHVFFAVEIEFAERGHVDRVDRRRGIFGRVVGQVARPVEIDLGLPRQQVVVLVQAGVGVQIVLVERAGAFGRISIVVFVSVFGNGIVEIVDQALLQR